MNNVHSRDGFYCELLLCLLISYNKFTLSNIGFLLTVDGNTETLLPVSELPCILSLIR